MSKLIVGAIQMQSGDDKEANLLRAEAFINVAVEGGPSSLRYLNFSIFVALLNSIYKMLKQYWTYGEHVVCQSQGKPCLYFG
jgi:hypothetical protein